MSLRTGVSRPLLVIVAVSLVALGGTQGAVKAGAARMPPSPGEAPFAPRSVTVSTGTNVAVSVSPDGQSLVMDLQGVLWRLPTSGGKARRITGNLDDPALPDWSPHGDHIAYQAYTGTNGGNYHIWTMRPDGSGKRQWTHGQYDNREPVYSPDGNKIAFSSDRAGSYDIWVLDLRTHQLTRWTDAQGEEYQPTWSPTGAEIAFVSDGGAIASVDATGDRDTLVVEDRGGITSPSWSPDGRRVAYILTRGLRSDLMISGEQVTYGQDVFPFPVEWISPTEILYTANGHIVRRDLRAGTKKNIPFEVTLSVRESRYEPKSHHFDSRRSLPVRGIVSPELSPDGKRVAFVALNDLWVMRIRQTSERVVATKPRPVTDDPYLEVSPTWSPDGTSLAYSSDRAGTEDIYLRELASGAERRLTDKPGAEVRLDWSPNGRTIAFQDQNYTTYTVSVGTGAVREVMEAPSWEPGAPTWGPDSQTIALAALKAYSGRFREGTSQILVVDVKSGERHFVDPIPFASLSNRVDSGPVWSPDGHRIAFVTGSTLRVLPVDSAGRHSGEPRVVVDEVSEAPSWSPDSQRLLYLSNGRLRLVSASGGEPRTVPVALRWRRDLPNRQLIVHAGRMWDGKSRTLRRNVDIVVRGNRIVDVRPHRGGRHRGRFVDASGLTVMPGLWDAHVHQELARPFLGARQERQLLAFGITSTVSMGDPAYRMVEDREALASGARLGPRLFASGEPIDGSRIYYNFMRPTTSLEQLKTRELPRANALDYDLLKTYVRLPYKYQREAITAAHAMGVPAFSHYFYPSMALGQDGMSHISATQRLGFSRTVSPGVRAYEDVIELAGASGMSVTSTLFSANSLLEYSPDLLSDRRIRTLYSPWQRATLKRDYREATETDQSQERTLLRRGVGVLDEILAADGEVLAGTDIPLVNVAVSLHMNLRAMVRYGMSEYEALRTATVLPARKLGVAEDLGTIETGKLADLTFVRGDPLRDIRAAAEVHSVMKGGEVFTMPEIMAPFESQERGSPVLTRRN